MAFGESQRMRHIRLVGNRGQIGHLEIEDDFARIRTRGGLGDCEGFDIQVGFAVCGPTSFGSV